MPDSATTVELSYPADLSGWGRDKVEGSPFRAYLRKTRDIAETGDVWTEFVGVGCCGDTLDFPLRVESVDGGAAVTEDTEFVYIEREACGVAGGWQVQSAAGPTE
ncbi:hypothetical protein NDI54_11025 [Haloarcula sp. S1AR25-5A]|uniref:DUF7968 domain-containing protein n=1 Tax=Haloarcula terrestris TaxID=2950533 RepID=A0AAE4EXD2_9EURY|nr:hypothetical protein [Haloarcula terrestris]MDS0221880.1 hypothetical protein [Haloarcula terrestris]